MKTRTGGYKNGVANSAKYLLKTDPEGDSIDCSIERLDGESDHAYAMRIEKIFESARVPNQKNLYQHNALAFHPTDGEKLTDAQMIDIAKEVYLKKGLGENRHYLFVVERNTEHPHVHALLHLTDLDTNRVNNKFVKYNPILEKLENKYGLYNQHRMPTPENADPSNDIKSEKDLKKNFKSELKPILENALKASEFLILANNAGFDITHNGQMSYSLTKDDQTFKASDLGMSYKTLKARFGDDPEFSTTLARLDAKRAKNDGLGAISFDMYVTQADLDKYEAKKKKSNRVLDTRFDSPDGHDFFFKDTNKKAFEYDAMRGRVDFNNNSPTAVKAGLQKLTENVKKPTSFTIGGGDYAKSQIWLQFHLMGLDKKGHTLSGYSPTHADKLKLEQEQIKFSVKISEPAENVTQKNDENVTQKNEHNAESSASEKRQLIDSSWKLENFTKFNIEDVKSKKEEKTRAEKAAESGAAGVLAGFVKALCSLENSYTYNKIDDHLQPLRVIDKEHKDKNDEAESEYHKNKRRKRNKPRPQ